MTGNIYRECVFPLKTQESFKNLELPEINMPGVNLSGADLELVNLNGANLEKGKPP